TSNNKLKDVTTRQYWVGIIVTIFAVALHGFILPVIELLYKKTKRRVTYLLVMELQLIMSFFASVVCGLGMVINKDFQAIRREAKASDMGELNYYMTLV
ncbi:hypothetical protein KI387_027708, partial [Taxus chinensis]